jgi:hypothetical protein
MATKRDKPQPKAAREGDKPKRRRVKAQTGQLVGIPLLDGTFALAHIGLVQTAMYFQGTLATVLFARRAASLEELREGLDDALRGQPISVVNAIGTYLTDGFWPVIGMKEPSYPANWLAPKTTYTSNMVSSIFEAYYGLRPWDESVDPRMYEKRLLPGVPVPPTIRFKADFEREAAAAAAAAASTKGAADEPTLEVTEGPGEIQIEITYPGEGLPSIELLHRREALERALEAAGAGEVTGAGGGGGVMDIFLQTGDVARALPLVEAAVKEAGFDKDARIETVPLDEEEEEDGDSDA